MSAAQLLLAFTLGTALLAVWSFVRWPSIAPTSLKSAMFRVLVALVLLQRISIKQTRGSGGLHRAIAAMNVLFQQRAGLVAMDADAVPAIVDGPCVFVGDVQGVGRDHRLRSLSAVRPLRAARSCNRLAPAVSP